MIGGISVLGVALGVAALIVVLSVMNGFDEEIKDKIIGTYADLIVLNDRGINDQSGLVAELSGLPGVEKAAPFITGQAILVHNKVSTGMLIKGIDIKKEAEVTDVMKFTSIPGAGLNEDTVILGSELMRNQRIFTGDTVEIMVPYSALDIEKKKLKVVGSFTSGRYDYDANIALISLPLAQEIFRMENNFTGVGIKTGIKGEKDLDTFRNELQSDLGFEYTVRTWMDLDKNLVMALAVEKKMMFSILAIIVMVACFNIMGSLIMMVMEKTKDIGILKAIGAGSAGISLVFFQVGAIVGGLGITLGTLLGLGIAKNVNYISGLLEKLLGVEVFPSDIYYFSEIPVNISFDDTGIVIMTAFLLAVAAGVYPAFKASRMDPVEAIRYE